MKVAVINFSGNVGKTTVARQLLAPRLKAPEFAIESINAGASDDPGDSERLRDKDFGSLQDSLMELDSAIVDVGASNVEDFVGMMRQFDGAHEDFDYFVVPVVSDKKQQQDTVNTITMLSALGVPPKRIRVLFNKVEVGEEDAISRRFGFVTGFHSDKKSFTLRPEAAIFSNEIYDRLRTLKCSVSDLVADQTDYRAQLREAKDEAGKTHAISMIAAQRLARSANRNLDAAYTALFR